ncbi:hypothetical protein [Achromobacter xylosoxidans]|uniref:hypothetical protein n=1 Tax=Alcaligenes xylosoxydans xylosoxydans TaxID=85698 RepID=UPI001F13E42D|nr:hypothetical protein [Achromobacter xylosoxidans]
MGSRITAFILPAELPGEQWKPSNGTVGYSFVSDACGTCERDHDEDCDILARSFRGDAVEWRRTEEDGCFCMAYVPAGEQLPETPDPLNLCLDLAQSSGQGAGR